MPEISFRIAQWSDRPVLSQLLELYPSDLSEVWPQDLNMHGEYDFAVGFLQCFDTTALEP